MIMGVNQLKYTSYSDVKKGDKMDYIVNLFEWTNKNSGVVSIIAIFIGHALVLHTVNRNKKSTNKELKEALLVELLANLDFLTSIKRVHDKNLLLKERFGVPTRVPRLSVIESLFRFEQLSSLNKRDKYLLANVYGKLSKFYTEYYILRDYLFRGLIENPFEYKQVSTCMINTFDELMTNMMFLWTNMIEELGNDSIHPVIRDIHYALKQSISNGERIIVSYAASEAKRRYKIAFDQSDTILCWINDLPSEYDEKIIINCQKFIPEEGI